MVVLFQFRDIWDEAQISSPLEQRAVVCQHAPTLPHGLLGHAWVGGYLSCCGKAYDTCLLLRIACPEFSHPIS